ncbi:MAG: hypothetical protein PGN25_10705 [Methylorubrum populi]
MLATWLAALLFLFAVQSLLVVKLADRLTSDAAQNAPAGRSVEAPDAADRYARAA